MDSQKKIFISHSTKDKALAEIIVDLAVACGISIGEIFCSSYKGTDVKQQISPEIKQALSTSILDIIILSNDYKESLYCLNEAGVIWYKSNNLKLIVTLPEVFDEPIAGFIGTDYIQFRLKDDEFCDSFYDSFIDFSYKLGVTDIVMNYSNIRESFAKQIDRYKKNLPIIENLSTNNKKVSSNNDAKSSAKTAQLNIRKIINCSCVKQIPLVFYEHYTRCVVLKAIEQGKIEVQTTTDCTIVNLSNKPYFEMFSSQFLRKDGGFDTFKDKLLIDGKEVCINHDISTPHNCPYVICDGSKIEIKPHKMANILYSTSYTIAPEKFYQSKLIKIPCGNYQIRARFDNDFINTMKQDYIFRYQVIPCVPRNLSYGVVPVSKYTETEEKHFVSYSAEDGFPAGGGYVLVINKN